MSKSPNMIARVALVAASMAMIALAVVANRDQQPIAPLGFANPGGGFVPPTRMNPGTGGGDVTDVIAGTGLTGGGTTGAVTLNVGCGTGLTCAADSVSLDPSALFSTLNVIPKGNGTGLTSSSLTDNGTNIQTPEPMFVGITSGTSTNAFLNVGRNVSVSTNAENGWLVQAFTDGNIYVDHKTITGGKVFYRFGSGASSGAANTWMALDMPSGSTTFTNPVGIGLGPTTTPSTRLHVRGSGGTSGITPGAGTTVTIENTASDNYLSLLDNTNNQGILFGNGTAATDGRIIYTTGRELHFYTANAIRNVMDASGDLGLDDSTPGNKLTVTGAASATSGLYTNESRTIGINESGGSLQFRTNNLDAQMTLDASANLTLNGYEQVKGTPTVNNDGITFGFTAPFGIIASKNNTVSPASNLVLRTTDVGGTTNDVLTLFFDKSVFAPGYMGIGIAPDSNVGLKIAKPSGATYGLFVSTGTAHIAEALNVNGSATLGDTPASDTHTINGVTTVKGGSTTNQLRLSDAIGNYWGLGRDNLSTGDFHISTSAGTKIAVSSSTANNTLVIDSSSKATWSADLAVNGNTTIGNANTDTLTIPSKVNSNVHYTGTATTLSSCGTASSSVTGNNRRGKIIPGTASPTSCTLNFAGGGDAWATAPICTVTGQKGTELITSISTSTLVIGSGGTGWSSAAGGGADQPIYYFCDGL